MKRFTIALSLCTGLALAISATAAAKKELPPASKKAGVTFDKDIKPIFEKACFECHGDKKQKGKLRLDSLAATLKGGENGKAVVAGKSADSSLVKAVARVVEDDAMPPEGKGKPLTNEQIGLIRAWIDQGAK
ncbi:MAG: c-type cytochrome domain-containing protein [Limisphaerales bacterium]